MRIAALDAHPRRWEQGIAALLGVGVSLLVLGWALGRG